MSIMHSAKIATGGIGDSSPHPVQAYAIQLGDGKSEIRLDLNPSGPITVVDLIPADARKVIAMLRACLIDLDEGTA